MGGTVTEQVASFPGTVASPTTRRDTVLVYAAQFEEVEMDIRGLGMRRREFGL